MAIDIKALCEKHWPAWKSDCSGFVKAVAGDLAISLTGTADEIVDEMAREPWVQLGHDADQAVAHANAGAFVVAGLKASPNGHLAIVVPGSAHPHPTGYWGKLHSVGRENTTLNWAWTAHDLTLVRYFARQP